MVKFIIMGFVSLSIFMVLSCHEVTVGYLEADEAVYVPDSLVIPLEWTEDSYLHWHNEADWVSTKIQGILGTAPIRYRITNVKVEGKGDAEIMKTVCMINGGGIFCIPFVHEIPEGVYIMSIEISNDGYCYTKEDIFKIIVK